LAILTVSTVHLHREQVENAALELGRPPAVA